MELQQQQIHKKHAHGQIQDADPFNVKIIQLPNQMLSVIHICKDVNQLALDVFKL